MAPGLSDLNGQICLWTSSWSERASRGASGRQHGSGTHLILPDTAAWARSAGPASQAIAGGDQSSRAAAAVCDVKGECSLNLLQELVSSLKPLMLTKLVGSWWQQGATTERAYEPQRTPANPQPGGMAKNGPTFVGFPQGHVRATVAALKGGDWLLLSFWFFSGQSMTHRATADSTRAQLGLARWALFGLPGNLVKCWGMGRNEYFPQSNCSQTMRKWPAERQHQALHSCCKH